MKKIMMLLPLDIFPPVYGTGTLVYNFIKYISKNNKVHALLSRLHSQHGKIDIVHENVNISYCPRSIFDRFRVLSFLFNPFYFKSAYQIMKNFNSDIIHCEVLWTAFAGIFLKKRFNKPMVLVEHNVEYLKFRSIGKPAYFTYFLKEIERIACRYADKVVTLSEIDKRNLVNLYGISRDKIEVISPSLDLGIFKYTEEGRKAIRKKYNMSEENVILTFVGTLESPPNIAAVKHITEKIYPIVIEKYPESKFLIIGRNANHVSKYKEKNMLFTGYLERSDLIDHLSASDIVMVPIDSGSGIRVKILEAAACSRSIIATEKGAEGLNFVNENEIILTPGNHEFVAGVINLIEDRGLRKTLGENARKKVEAQYSWERMIEKFEKIYNEII